MSENKFHAPVKVSLEIYITNGEGVAGIASVSLKTGLIPTQDQITEAIEEFKRGLMPDGFRCMTKSEWLRNAAKQRRSTTEGDDDDE